MSVKTKKVAALELTVGAPVEFIRNLPAKKMRPAVRKGTRGTWLGKKGRFVSVKLSSNEVFIWEDIAAALLDIAPVSGTKHRGTAAYTHAHMRPVSWKKMSMQADGTLDIVDGVFEHVASGVLRPLSWDASRIQKNGHFHIENANFEVRSTQRLAAQFLAKQTITKDTDIKGWDEYQKTEPTKAVQMEEDFEVETLEGTMQGHEDDYLAQGPEGERYPIKKTVFDKTYKKLAAQYLARNRQDHYRAARGAKDKVPGGLADKKKPSDFDAKALAKGVKVEMEHTDDPALAREIAMDHLTEHADYYDALEVMEKKLEQKKAARELRIFHWSPRHKGKQVNAIVAAFSVAEVSRISGETTGTLKTYGSFVSAGWHGNYPEAAEKAMAHPGKMFVTKDMNYSKVFNPVPGNKLAGGKSLSDWLDSMDLPSQRKDTSKPANVRWLLRNIAIENKGHKDLEAAVAQLKGMAKKAVQRVAARYIQQNR